MPFDPIPRCAHLVARPGCACCSAEVRAVTARVEAGLSRRGFLAGTTASVGLLGLEAYALEAPARDGRAVLFRNVRLFDGLGPNTRPGVSVLVVGDRIAEIAGGELAPPDGARVIEGAGRTLMPGLIDAHWHCMMASLPIARLMTMEEGDIHLAAAAQAERTLMRGFTSVRDLGGPAFPLKRAIDAGIVAGPRIWPCGAMISQTSGHADFRMLWELPGGGAPSRAEATGMAAVADGRAAVLRATREQLMRGASQIKIAAGGGASSPYDPIDTTQFLTEEIEAAVRAAADWGTYVCAHVYTPTGIRRCLEAGVRSIEHGQLADEDAVKRMADGGAVWSLQPFVEALSSERGRTEQQLAKIRQVWEGTDAAYALAIKHGVPLGFGSDILFDAQAAEGQGANLAYLRRWFTPAQALKQATADNAFILGLSGPRNPYPGRIGVVARGAWADLLLVEGDPTENLSLVADPDANFSVIMKGGVIHKDAP